MAPPLSTSPSTGKDSTTSSLSDLKRESAALAAPATLPRSPAAPTTVTCLTPSYAVACRYPADAPHRAAYLATRALTIALALGEIALAVVAQVAVNRGRWMSPMLSPAITVLFHGGIDTLCVVRAGRRAHPLTRLLYDGALGVGFAIASGFLVSFTLGDVTLTSPTSTIESGAVGGLILFFMFSST